LGLLSYMRTISTQSILSREVAEFVPLPLQKNFGTFPLDYMTNVSAFFSEFLGTAILVFIVFTVTDLGDLDPHADTGDIDPRNADPRNVDPSNAKPKPNVIPPTLAPVILFVVLLGIALCLGMETGFAVNPARDLGPRLLTSMVGYGGAVYSFRNQYWLWGGVMASILGGLIGGFFYEILFSSNGTSIVMRALTRKKPNGSNNNVSHSI